LSKKNNKKRFYSNQPQTIPINRNNNNDKDNNSHEFSSYRSQVAYSKFYFGYNIFNEYSHKQLMNVLRYPMENNKLLREISLSLYGTCGAYTNIVDFLVSMPTLDKVVVAHGKNKNQKAKNKDLMTAALRTIKDDEFVRDALFCGMIEGVAFYYLETTSRPNTAQKFYSDFEVDSIFEINEIGMNASIISLPTDYTQIMGMKNNSYQLAFNLKYFNDYTGEPTEKLLKKFPKEIREAYSRWSENKSQQKGSWYLLDNTKTITFKIRSKRTEKWGRPLVLAAIRDILYEDYFTATKRNTLKEINNKVVYQTFPEGQNKGICALTRQQQDDQHNIVKNAIMNKNSLGQTTVISVSAGTKLNTLDVSNTDIFDEKYESDLPDKITSAMGMARSLLSGIGGGSFSAQTQNLELLTAKLFQWIKQISNELNKCISNNIIENNKNRVEFKYLPMTFVNKKEMVANMKDLYLQGKGSLTAWASACGLSPDVFYALLDQELEEDVENKYPVHQTSYTYSSKNDSTTADNKGGRPTTDNPTENTVKSQNNNGNALPSPSD